MRGCVNKFKLSVVFFEVVFYDFFVFVIFSYGVVIFRNIGVGVVVVEFFFF